METAMTKCSRFKHCNANVCPLDENSYLRNKLEDEPKCKIAKSIRLRIGTEYGLPKLGLTDKEFSFRQRWENKSEEEKIEIKNRLAETGFQKRDQNRP